MQDAFLALSEALSATAFSDLVRLHSGWVIPLVQSIHILGIAAVMGTIVLIDLRVLGLAVPSQPVAGMVRRLMPVLWGALVVLLATGIVMIMGEPNRSVANPVFQVKMLLLLIVLGLTLYFTGKVRRDGLYWEASGVRRASARTLAAVSVLIWVLIVFAGRWIAYFDISLLGLG
jgi:hypothetical protein